MTDTSPTIVNRTLPRRLPNSAYRVREYLTEKEVEQLIDAARKRGRNGARDAAAILLAYRHGLRAQELCGRRWAQVALRQGHLRPPQPAKLLSPQAMPIGQQDRSGISGPVAPPLACCIDQLLDF